MNSRMRNAVYSSFPSTQLNNNSFGIGIGNNQVVHQIPTSDFSVSNSSSSSFFRDSQVCNDQHLGSFAPLSSIDIPPSSSSSSSSSLNYLQLPTAAPGSLTSTTTATNFMNETTFQTNFTQMRRLVNQFAEATPFESEIKHKIKAEISRMNRESAVEESRKRKAICVDDHQRPYHDDLQRPYHPIQEQPPLETRRLPVKRSQKITDRITALQKLVSPFGKTDTASVLQEASVYIKLLHEQIQMLSTPYFAAGSLIQQGVGGGRSHDLRSRGLCLVPVSFTRNMIRQDTVDHTISRRSMIPQNY